VGIHVAGHLHSRPFTNNLAKVQNNTSIIVT